MEPTIQKGERDQKLEIQPDAAASDDLETTQISSAEEAGPQHAEDYGDASPSQDPTSFENPIPPEIESLTVGQSAAAPSGQESASAENPLAEEGTPLPGAGSTSTPSEEEFAAEESSLPAEFTPLPATQPNLTSSGQESASTENSAVQEIAPLPVPEPTLTPTSQQADPGQNPPALESTPMPGGEPSFELSSLEVAPIENPRKIALILSGGGARGSFQVGAEKYAREVKGYQWDIIAGVSVGAMNGAMLAMHRYARLLDLWDHLSDDQVYTGGFNALSLIKILLGAKGFFGNQPLINLMQSEFEAGRILDDLHVGAVSLISGEYVQFTRESLELPKAILASAAIPVVWPPVDVSPDFPAMVDGGVRNITPIGDVLDLEPDELVIINCGKEQPQVAPTAAHDVLTIGMRTLDIMQNEIFVNDMKEFLRINALVKEAEQQGAVLHHPKSGRVLKYYSCQVIEPDIELGATLDFSQKSIQLALKTGVRRAREVLGRP